MLNTVPQTHVTLTVSQTSCIILTVYQCLQTTSTRIPPAEQNLPNQKHTTGGIPRWSPTLVLVARFSAYVWQSGRDAQFSLTYGRMYHSDYYMYYIEDIARQGVRG
jgi:hypothetical protein